MGNAPGSASARRGVSKPLLSSTVGNRATGLVMTCVPVATARGAPSASTMVARVVPVARPALTISVSTANPAIGTGRARSTVSRARRRSGSVRSSARASSAVGGPPWHASGSHGPRA